MFPISRDPPEGGTPSNLPIVFRSARGFQFLGIPPKGERRKTAEIERAKVELEFPISRDPPEGGTDICKCLLGVA